MDKERIIEMANRLVADGPVDVPRAIDTHDLVWAVWPDKGEPGGVDTLLIKGDLTIFVEATATAIHCAGLKMAMALKKEFGE